MFLGHEIHKGPPTLEVDGWQIVTKEQPVKPKPDPRSKSRWPYWTFKRRITAERR